MTVHIAGNLAQVNADIRNRAMNDAPGGCPSASFDGHAGRAR